MGIDRQVFGSMPDGRPVTLYTLTNRQGTSVSILDFGGYVIGLKTADRNGNFAEIVLSYKTFKDYLEDRQYFGCIVGRYANRIADSRFRLDGKTYPLPANEGKHHLHGGKIGFGKRLWTAQSGEKTEGPQLVLYYLSPDMEEGYPGNLKAAVVYTLTHDNALKIDYEAECDRATIVNLTHHFYFNLTGRPGLDCLDHEVMIQSERFLAVINEAMIPSGEMRPVQGTPMDFLKPQAIGKRIHDPYDQLLWGGGYDHTWILDKKFQSTTRSAASAHDPLSGRLMEVFTTQPGLHLYAGNRLGHGFIRHGAFCFEAQKYPDSPHHPEFPCAVLSKGEKYAFTTIYRFSVQ